MHTLQPGHWPLKQTLYSVLTAISWILSSEVQWKSTYKEQLWYWMKHSKFICIVFWTQSFTTGALFLGFCTLGYIGWDFLLYVIFLYLWFSSTFSSSLGSLQFFNTYCAAICENLILFVWAIKCCRFRLLYWCCTNILFVTKRPLWQQHWGRSSRGREHRFGDQYAARYDLG